MNEMNPVCVAEDIQVGCRELRAKRYISDGFCTSTKPIKEVVCAGHCLPIMDLPWYAEFVKVWARSKLRDWQCEEDVVKRKSVHLLCRNGQYRTYRIKVVKSCKCKKSRPDDNRTDNRDKKKSSRRRKGKKRRGGKRRRKDRKKGERKRGRKTDSQADEEARLLARHEAGSDVTRDVTNTNTDTSRDRRRDPTRDRDRRRDSTSDGLEEEGSKPSTIRDRGSAVASGNKRVSGNEQAAMSSR